MGRMKYSRAHFFAKESSSVRTAVVLLMSLLLGVSAAAQSSVWVRIDAPANELPADLANAALGVGSQSYLELSEADYARLPASLPQISATRDAFALKLPNFTGDPLRNPPPGSAKSLGAGGFMLVQLKGPTQPEWLAAIRASGAEVLDALPPYGHLLWADQPARQELSGFEFVRWAGALSAALRQSEPLLAPLTGPMRAVVLRSHAPADADFAAVGAFTRSRAPIDAVYEVVELDGGGSHSAALLGLPGVLKLESIPQDGGSRGELASQINVLGFNGSGVPIPGYRAWLSARNLGGTGVVIANVDGGVDQTHPVLTGRVQACTGSTCSNTSSSHGTHTAGIMAGNGNGDVRDAAGFLRGLGVAPRATLIEQVYQGFFSQPGGMLLLMTQSQRNGAVISGNSWGPASTPRGYDSDTRQVDVGTRDADPALAGNQALLFVLSVMNGNGGTSSQGTPDEAKNTFSIGSTRAQNSDLSVVSDINSISSNSAHGPALDGRIIPHMVAPGCRVDSSIPGSYGGLCGTSMASPQVSGAAALFVEKQRRELNQTPSPALVKAAFTAVARDLKGNRDASNIVLPARYSPRQGWGRMDLKAVFDAPRGSVIQLDQSVLLTRSGDSYTVSPQILDPTQPVRIMLAWTDAPGNPLGGATPAWTNDLDLSVRTRRVTWWGNAFDADGWSISAGAPDGRNNLEGAMFQPGQLPPDFEIVVSATNLSGDGVPGNDTSTDQDFALVCYNCVIPGVSDLVFKNGY